MYVTEGSVAEDSLFFSGSCQSVSQLPYVISMKAGVCEKALNMSTRKQIPLSKSR